MRRHLRDREGHPGKGREDRRGSSKGRDNSLRTVDISSRVGRRHRGRIVRMGRSRIDRRHRAITHEANHPTRPVLPVRVPAAPPVAILLKVHLPREVLRRHPFPFRKQRVHPKAVPTGHRLHLPGVQVQARRRDNLLATPGQVHHPREDHLRDHREATNSILHTSSSSSSDIQRHRMLQGRTIGHPIRRRISTSQ